MIVTREAIIAEAWRWHGTPHRWQQSVRGKGCDCRGFVFGVARALNLPEAEVPEVGVSNYNTKFSPDQLLSGLEKALRRTESPQPGDVLLMVMGRIKAPRHLGIMTTPGRMLHSYGRGPEQVIESPICRLWPVHSYWTWPSLGD